MSIFKYFVFTFLFFSLGVIFPQTALASFEPDNKFLNPSFELSSDGNDPDDWNIINTDYCDDDYLIESGLCLDGDDCMTYYIETTAEVDACGLSQEVRAPFPNGSFQFSFWVRKLDNSEPTTTVYSSFFYDDNSEIWNFENDEWEEFEGFPLSDEVAIPCEVVSETWQTCGTIDEESYPETNPGEFINSAILVSTTILDTGVVIDNTFLYQEKSNPITLLSTSTEDFAFFLDEYGEFFFLVIGSLFSLAFLKVVIELTIMIFKWYKRIY